MEHKQKPYQNKVQKKFGFFLFDIKGCLIIQGNR